MSDTFVSEDDDGSQDHLKAMGHVVVMSAQIEDMLRERLGAQGRGLHELIESCGRKLPPAIAGRLRFFATIRNKLVHTGGHEVQLDENFLDQCNEIKGKLELQFGKTRTPRRLKLASKRTTKSNRKTKRVVPGISYAETAKREPDPASRAPYLPSPEQHRHTSAGLSPDALRMLPMLHDFSNTPLLRGRAAYVMLPHRGWFSHQENFIFEDMFAGNAWVEEGDEEEEEEWEEVPEEERERWYREDADAAGRAYLMDREVDVMGELFSSEPSLPELSIRVAIILETEPDLEADEVLQLLLVCQPDWSLTLDRVLQVLLSQRESKGMCSIQHTLCITHYSPYTLLTSHHTFYIRRTHSALAS
jgi:hypothetical protein